MIGSGRAVTVAEARADDAVALVALLRARPPASWMSRASRRAAAAFVRHALCSPHAVLVAARAAEGVAGYGLALTDARRFWRRFAVSHPAAAVAIVCGRLLAAPGPSAPAARADAGQAESLPPLDWSPAGAARTIGVFVGRGHERDGAWLDLYFALWAGLRRKGARRVEEHLSCDFTAGARAFFQLCGGTIERCAGGYKLSKTLDDV